MSLTLAQADAIANAIFDKSREMKTKPIAVAVVDKGGNPLVLKRHEDAGFLYVDMVLAKAKTAIGLGRPVKTVGTKLVERGVLGAVTTALKGNFLPLAGSILLQDGNGNIIGGVGVGGPSGGDVDEACAVAGIQAAGFVAAA